MSEAYSTKEMLTEIRLDQKEHNERSIRMEEILNAVLEQAKKTNGRVTGLEALTASHTADISRWKVMSTTLASVVGIIWTVATFIFK
jgi:hypothetical protein